MINTKSVNLSGNHMSKVAVKEIWRREKW